MYSYSVNDEEHFTGEFNSREEALEHAKIEAEESDYEIGDTVTLYTGKNLYPIEILDETDIVDGLLERFDEIIYDDIRFDDDSCFEMSDEHKKEFHDLIIDFVKKNATHPNYWSIFEIKENEYKITGEW